METIIKFITVLAWVAVVVDILFLWGVWRAIRTGRILFADSEEVGMVVLRTLALLVVSVTWIIAAW